ncbi:beta-ketoacyl synthase N-terminal-like domain-containing protein [Nostoc favosum]|uniref:Beta-ketoacyl synthase-like N-terminal domain-containing protein n=1 Tax=Nostoc favosum CHAB5714 TaxID=2780399 RepID=A0ABS8IG97_9NOSO|nr:beta-ketoacyl synthase N-terminal-like domain-containing protein [Nostoc favosum]MCC5603263.1 hypothetical protein [Nostoc favosum CHAB5714]
MTSICPIVISGIGPICSQATTVTELSTVDCKVQELSNMKGVNWFEPKRFFGSRGFKYFPLATQYILAAAKLALEDANIQDNSCTPEEKGVVLGTNFAIDSICSQMDRVVMTEGATALSPMEAPNFSVNLPASYVSIKYGFRAFNISLTSSVVAGLESIIFGAHSIRQGRAKIALVGATEDSPPSQISEVLGVPVKEGGACALILETLPQVLSRQARIYCQVGKGSLRFFNPKQLQEVTIQERLRKTIRQELERLIPVDRTSIHYCPLICSFAFNQTVDSIIRETLAARNIQVFSHNYIGATGALITVSPLLQMAALAIEHGEGLILATSPHGHIAMLTLEKVM